jgi:hypothetical protein
MQSEWMITLKNGERVNVIEHREIMDKMLNEGPLLTARPHMASIMRFTYKGRNVYVNREDISMVSELGVINGT